MNNYIV